MNDDRFFLLYGIEDESENNKTCYMIIDSKGNIQKSGSMDKRFYCTSEPSVKGEYDHMVSLCRVRFGTFSCDEPLEYGERCFSCL